MTKIKVLFKGGCLRYDAVDKILIATPFSNTVCWNWGDWVVIVLPIVNLLLTIIYLILDYFEDKLCPRQDPRFWMPEFVARIRMPEFVARIFINPFQAQLQNQTPFNDLTITRSWPKCPS